MEFNKFNWILASMLGLVLFASCSSADSPEITQEITSVLPSVPPIQPTDTVGVPGDQASVLEVGVSGETGSYRFSVRVSSPDEGCNQYADWWEVISQDGDLIYRRILLHSHVDEQPFTRSGGPVPIDEDTIVLVRAHMNTTGYGRVAMKGSPLEGFNAVEINPDFAAQLSEEAPLPEGCDF
jgi:hypothetical protein